MIAKGMSLNKSGFWITASMPTADIFSEKESDDAS
jgi:hypothetical protein